jgi:hypothetical protein
MECKVKIGSAYEPRWFERRQTNGWYSAKNPTLDSDGMWLQNSMIGVRRPRRVLKLAIVGAAWIAAGLIYLSFFM